MAERKPVGDDSPLLTIIPVTSSQCEVCFQMLPGGKPLVRGETQCEKPPNQVGKPHCNVHVLWVVKHPKRYYKYSWPWFCYNNWFTSWIMHGRILLTPFATMCLIIILIELEPIPIDGEVTKRRIDMDRPPSRDKPCDGITWYGQTHNRSWYVIWIAGKYYF